MRTHLISYDLMEPGKNYEAVIARIKALGNWCHPLLSAWLVRANLTHIQVRDQLLPTLDARDKLLVVDVTADAAAWTNTLPADVANWLRTNLPLAG